MTKDIGNNIIGIKTPSLVTMLHKTHYCTLVATLGCSVSIPGFGPNWQSIENSCVEPINWAEMWPSHTSPTSHQASLCFSWAMLGWEELLQAGTELCQAQLKLDSSLFCFWLATNWVGVGLSWAELSSVLSLGVEIKAISAQPTEVGIGLSWAELGNKIYWQFYSQCRKFVEGNYHWELFLSKMIPRNAGADHQMNLVNGSMAWSIYLVCNIQSSVLLCQMLS